MSTVFTGLDEKVFIWFYIDFLYKKIYNTVKSVKGKVMDLIESFSVDHTAIIPGIFKSREDKIGDQTVTTYDVRLKRPNAEPVIDVAAMHTLEHLIATVLRNGDDKNDIIYWGPMGCLTGF